MKNARGWRFAFLLGAAFLLAGCQSSAFRARQLPPEFRSAARTHKQTIDLSRVASLGVSSSVIAPSDLLEITITTGRDDEKVAPVLARVADDGTIGVPVVGPVPVAGMEAFDASHNIANFAVERGIYRHPIVTVEIKQKAVNRITVLGAVKEPGVHELPRGSSDLVSALAAAGGLTEEAGTEVEIVRQPSVHVAADGVQENPNPSSVAESNDLQLAAYQAIGNPSGAKSGGGPGSGLSNARVVRLDLASEHPRIQEDFRLNDRDVVRIVRRKEEMIYVTGLVAKPGQFELPAEQDLHLLDAIALAGGRSSPVADKVLIIRRVGNRPEPLVIQASLSEAKTNGLENLRLAAGDTITVEQTPSTMLVDTVSKFFRFTFGLANNTVF